MWDVGGCDKIRPLFRHYMTNIDLVILVIDSNDPVRLGHAEDTSSDENIDVFLEQLDQSDDARNCPLLVLANKQDLPNVLTIDEIMTRLRKSAYLKHDQHYMEILPISCVTGTNFDLILPTMCSILREKDLRVNRSYHPTMEKASKEVKQSPKVLFEQWLAHDDESDEEFLAKLEQFRLDSWDHRTHLRIAFVHLMRYGRREGMKQIFNKIKDYITNAAYNASRTTFHETMTYFWTHMVDYSIHTIKSRYASLLNTSTGLDFKTFLLFSPHLCNGGLFLQYYTKELMLHKSEARVQVLLPDIKPLPSIIEVDSSINVGSINGINDLTSINSSLPAGIILGNRAISDDEFMIKLRSKELTSWGHESKLRVIYIDIVSKGRSRDTLKNVMDILRPIEAQHEHSTIAYFWIHMMTIAIAQYKERSKADLESKLAEKLSFKDFINLPENEKLKDPTLLYT